MKGEGGERREGRRREEGVNRGREERGGRVTCFKNPFTKINDLMRLQHG